MIVRAVALSLALVAVALPQDPPRLTQEQITARAHLAQIGAACVMYKKLNGEDPKSLRNLVEKPPGVKAWPEGGFLLGGKLPLDPWGRDYQYDAGWQIPRVFTRGADGREGGKGEDADIAFAHVMPIAGAAPEPAAEDIAANERTAVSCMKELATAQADFHSNDRDGNLVNDFWTADVYSLRALVPITAGDIRVPAKPDPQWMMKLIDEDLANADAAPVREACALGQAPPGSPSRAPATSSARWSATSATSRSGRIPTARTSTAPCTRARSSRSSRTRRSKARPAA